VTNKNYVKQFICLVLVETRGWFTYTMTYIFRPIMWPSSGR